MKISFEYGQGLMDAELPDTTDVFVPGETIPDPPCIPEELLEEKGKYYQLYTGNEISA